MKKRSPEDKVASSSTNCWIDPAFTDLTGENLLVSGKKRGQVLGSKTEAVRPRKRKGETVSSGPCAMYPQKHSGHEEQDEPWVDRYTPCSKDDLAVHKKKTEEVESWLRVHTDTRQGGLLLLTGPPGCGKTAAVQVLSSELGLRIHEWTNPPNLDSYTINRMTNSLSSISQSAQFQEFLLRANKYNCLKMVGDGRPTLIKLIMVEEFPNQFYRKPSDLHDILRYFVKTSRCPLVFIVSNSPSGDSSSRFLFPREILEELDIINISFNPVAPTTMMKVLNRILTHENGKSNGRVIVPDQTVLEMVCSGSYGDIRSAINSLQFASVPDYSQEKDVLRGNNPMILQGKAVSRSTIRKKSKPTKGQEEEQTFGKKDTCLFLFRALGKILHFKTFTYSSFFSQLLQHKADLINVTLLMGGKIYNWISGVLPLITISELHYVSTMYLEFVSNKPNVENGGSPEGVKAAESAFGRLPSHLSQHHRENLHVDPEWVIERSYVSGEFFNLYLHQNYLDFFSGMEDVDKASEYMSDADLLTSDWMSSNTMGEYASSVVTRGLLHSNSQQVAVGFRPLHKPNWLLVSKKHQENCLAAQCLFRHFCMTPVSLQTELLPYLAKFTNPLRNQDQITFIQDVGHMSLKRFPVRLKLEALTDQEGQLKSESEEDIEDVQEGSQECLSASQPQHPATSIEEEDIMIEEYDSE
ncbi:cell cycle checkpoint protein RAD17 isoform X2 [Phyllopteryx taeniolatus]|uniref:cell cycle checkpoint protein RAD17 isoform X2 n=1 Tax=Phyllopteryx taeniolatus TaxID=161469 RepID=UPI002AD3680C|nr:cell cycle checkpoint protein RAD17 isoform X2 [Phyllopteryx taeniolatus]